MCSKLGKTTLRIQPFQTFPFKISNICFPPNISVNVFKVHETTSRFLIFIMLHVLFNFDVIIIIMPTPFFKKIINKLYIFFHPWSFRSFVFERIWFFFFFCP